MRNAALIGILSLLLVMPTYADPEPVQVSLVSVCGKNEGRQQKTFGEGLATVQRAVAPLDYDTFIKVSSSDATVPFGQQTTFYINSTYSLIVEPTSIDTSGRIRMRTQVMMKSKDENKDMVKALDTVLVMAPGKQLNLGGLKLDDGDLIIVISVK